MALINCPECIRENVSDTAEVCPDCGYAIKAHFEKIEAEETKKTIIQNRMNCVTMPEKPEDKMESNEKSLIVFGVICIIGGLLCLDIPILALFEFFCGGALIATAFKQKNDKYEKALSDYNLAIHNFEGYQKKKIHEQDVANVRRAMKEANSPKCPVCGSKNIKNISTFDRAVSVGTVGIASKKIGKQYQCKNCKHMW